MANRITASLPSRNLAATEAFFARHGLGQSHRGDGWIILKRGPLELEFFPHPGLDSKQSAFSACIRVDDPDALLKECGGVGLSADPISIPRLTGYFRPAGTPRVFALVDGDGSLLRVIDNRDAGVPDAR